MDTKITQLLNSSDVQDRKKAVRLLAQTGTQEALRVLAGVYKNDPDPEVKQLALKAGKHIKTQEVPAINVPQAAPEPPTRRKSATGSLLSRSTSTQERIAAPVMDDGEVHEFKPVFVSERRQEEAQDLLERGADAAANGEHDTAINLVVKAFKSNPNYRLDAYAMGIALNATQATHGEFLDMLEDDRLVLAAIRKVRGEKVKNIPKPKRKFGERDSNGDKPWTYLALEFGCYIGVLTAMGVVFLLIASAIYYNAAGVVARGCPDCTEEQAIRLANIVRETKPLLTYTVPQLFAYAVTLTLLVIAELCVYYFAFHAVARIVAMSFEGSLRGMLDYCARFDVAWQGLYCLLLFISCLLMLRDAFNPYLTLAMLRSTAFWEILTYISWVVFFGGWLWSVSRRMTYYNIGCFQVTCAMFLTGSITSWVLGNVLAGLVAQYSEALKALFM
jgi:hypothetical protein